MRARERLARLEQQLRPLPAPHIAELADMPKLLTFAEIEAGQRALQRFDGDALAAIEAGDALFTLLLVRPAPAMPACRFLNCSHKPMEIP